MESVTSTAQLSADLITPQRSVPGTGDASQSVSRSWDPLWLAHRWETYIRDRLNVRGYRLIKHGMFLPKAYQQVFDQLATYLRESGIHPDDYFTALMARAQYGRRFRWRLYVNNLGRPHFNAIVTEYLAQRIERLHGRSDPYDRLPMPRSIWGLVDQDVIRYATSRFTYRHLSRDVFWLAFVPEYTGWFLGTCPEFRACASFECFLTSTQWQAWSEVLETPALEQELREHCLAILRRYNGEHQAWLLSQWNAASDSSQDRKTGRPISRLR